MLTTREFQNYIESFNKKPGEYTLDELLAIGVKLKELPLAQRSWSSLAQLVGAPFSADAYRMRVTSYLKKLAEEQDLPEEAEAYKDSFTEKQQVRDWYNAFRRNLREEVRIDNLKEEIQHAAEKFKDLVPVCFEPYEREVDTYLKNEACLLISDLHIGVDCDNYYNKYNYDVARARIKALVERTVRYCRDNLVHTLNILNLGDMIQGLIHTNARVEAQMDVAEQIIKAGELVAEAVNELQEAAPVVTYRSVFDNHSRAIASKDEHIEKEQFSRIIDWFVQERLKDTGVQFMDNEVDGGIGKLILKNKKVVMYAHGHQDGRNSSFQNMVGLTREWVDYIFLAHYHNPAAKDYEGCKVFINGSIVGTESYAFGKRLFTRPSQKLLIFSVENEDVQDIDIML